MKQSLIPTIFWVLVGVFVFVVCQFTIPAIRDLLKGSTLFLVPIIIFSLLGVVLLVLTLKERITGRLQQFLLLTGAAATGFFVSILLHNLVYGLFKIEEPFFFIMAIFVCPLGFLIGVVGSIVELIKQRG